MAKEVQPKKLYFSQAMQTEKYKKLINNTLGDPVRAARFAANITSAVAVNPTLQECDAGTILAGALLGESLLLQPSPQLGQFYLVPFESKAKRDRQGNVIKPACLKAQFVLGYKGSTPGDTATPARITSAAVLQNPFLTLIGSILKPLRRRNNESEKSAASPSERDACRQRTCR